MAKAVISDLEEKRMNYTKVANFLTKANFSKLSNAVTFSSNIGSMPVTRLLRLLNDGVVGDAKSTAVSQLHKVINDTRRIVQLVSELQRLEDPSERQPFLSASAMYCSS